jgi:hypothetical protein
MSVIRLIAHGLICVAGATPVSADVTLRLKGIQCLSGDQSEITEYRKGLKWRVDFTSNGLTSSTIWDAGAAGRMVMLWHKSKRADVIDSRQISESFAKTGVPETSHSIMPTAQSRQIAGSTCTVYHVKSSFAYSEMERGSAMTMVMVIEGSTCLVKNGPGQADFTAFYQARSKSALGFDPRQELNRQMAELGVPFATEITISLGGGGPMAETKAIDIHRTEVSSVSTAPIPDSMFEIPADYEVIKR